MFDVKLETKKIIKNIRNWFNNESGNAKGCILGISGGKDSTIVAKLLCEAIGKDRVYGLLMPNGVQTDITDSHKVVGELEIEYNVFNIQNVFKTITNAVIFSDEALINISPRIRMTVLYAFAQSIGYRVIGTGNASERYIGYFTKHGDGACDFNPIKDYTCTEVIAIGDYLELPKDLVHKQPSDGLCGKSDEDRFGFSYEELDNYIRKIKITEQSIVDKIENMHKRSLHKLI